MDPQGSSASEPFPPAGNIRVDAFTPSPTRNKEGHTATVLRSGYVRYVRVVGSLSTRAV